MRPHAKTEGLLIEELDGEAVIYDLGSKMVHHLSREALQVWRSCDGKRTTDMIARRMRKWTTVEGGEIAVEAAVQQLQAAGLLLPEGDEKRLRTRREILASAARTVAVAAAVPLISSIAVPTPVMAASLTSLHPNNCQWVFDNRTHKWTCTASAPFGDSGGKCAASGTNCDIA